VGRVALEQEHAERIVSTTLMALSVQRTTFRTSSYIVKMKRWLKFAFGRWRLFGDEFYFFEPDVEHANSNLVYCLRWKGVGFHKKADCCECEDVIARYFNDVVEMVPA
jgi:hypothetical protein